MTDKSNEFLTVSEFNRKVVDIEKELYAFAFSFTRDSEQSKDLVQDVILKVLSNRTQYKAGTNFKAWVFTIMRNTYITGYNSSYRTKTVFDDSKELYVLNNSKGESISPESIINEKEIDKRMRSIDRKYRQPFIMHLNGFKYREICDQLEIPMGTVKSRIFIAKNKLRDSLVEYKDYLN